MNNETSRKTAPTSGYPGGGKTFFGKFERVKVEGRRGRSYWEWKSAEKSGVPSVDDSHDGDDELTSIESDTIRRTPPVGGVQCHPRSCGIKVFPPFLPPKYSQKSEEPLKPILKNGKELNIPSAPPKELVYADAERRHQERVKFASEKQNQWNKDPKCPDDVLKSKSTDHVNPRVVSETPKSVRTELIDRGEFYGCAKIVKDETTRSAVSTEKNNLSKQNISIDNNLNDNISVDKEKPSIKQNGATQKIVNVTGDDQVVKSVQPINNSKVINSPSPLRPKTAHSTQAKDNRKSGALVWINQPGGGAKLEWIPTPGLAHVRTVPVTQTGRSVPPAKSVVSKGGVAISNNRAQETIVKGSDGVEGNVGDGREGKARAEPDVTRVVSDADCAPSDGGVVCRSGEKCESETDSCQTVVEHSVDTDQETLGNSHSPKYTRQKNVDSSAPGEPRPAGRTYPFSGILNRRREVDSSSDGDRIVSVPGRNQGQVVRIRVRPEVHAYLSNLPVINSGYQRCDGRRDSIQSGSSASILTWGSGEGSIGYSESDYSSVIDEYTLLKKAVDEQDPEALRLLTEAESALSSDGDGSEYPYLKEMKERLLLSTEQTRGGMPSYSAHEQDHQLLEVQQTPVGTVVKLNADGYGSHTSPTHRVESLYTDTLQSRRTQRFEDFFPKNAKLSSSRGI